MERVCTGGYPEVQRLAARERPGWFRDYVLTTIERDVVELSGIRKVAEMGQLLRLFAARTGCELVMQGIIDDAPLERQAVYDQDRSGAEVDIVLEAPDGRVAAIEVKTGQTAKPEWFRWLGQMRDAIGDNFTAGIALYAGAAGCRPGVGGSPAARWELTARLALCMRSAGHGPLRTGRHLAHVARRPKPAS
jgi:predicted AAA+ superfamily ATPase